MTIKLPEFDNEFNNRMFPLNNLIINASPNFFQCETIESAMKKYQDFLSVFLTRKCLKVERLLRIYITKGERFVATFDIMANMFQLRDKTCKYVDDLKRQLGKTKWYYESFKMIIKEAVLSFMHQVENPYGYICAMIIIFDNVDYRCLLKQKTHKKRTETKEKKRKMEDLEQDSNKKLKSNTLKEVQVKRESKQKREYDPQFIMPSIVYDDNIQIVDEGAILPGSKQPVLFSMTAMMADYKLRYKIFDYFREKMRLEKDFYSSMYLILQYKGDQVHYIDRDKSIVNTKNHFILPINPLLEPVIPNYCNRTTIENEKYYQVDFPKTIMEEADPFVIYLGIQFSIGYHQLLFGIDRDLYIISLFNNHRIQEYRRFVTCIHTENRYHFCNMELVRDITSKHKGYIEAFFLIVTFLSTDFFDHTELLGYVSKEAIKTTVWKMIALQKLDFLSSYDRFKKLIEIIYKEANKIKSCKSIPNPNIIRRSWFEILDALYYWATMNNNYKADHPGLLDSSKQILENWKPYFLSSISTESGINPPSSKIILFSPDNSIGIIHPKENDDKDIKQQPKEDKTNDNSFEELYPQSSIFIHD
jgi:hypothetical protein